MLVSTSRDADWRPTKKGGARLATRARKRGWQRQRELSDSMLYTGLTDWEGADTKTARGKRKAEMKRGSWGLGTYEEAGQSRSNEPYSSKWTRGGGVAE